MSIKRLQSLAMQYESEEEFLKAMSKIYDLAKEDNLNMQTHWWMRQTVRFTENKTIKVYCFYCMYPGLQYNRFIAE